MNHKIALNRNSFSDMVLNFFSTHLVLLLRWFLGITFIYASVHKIVNPADFAKVIYGYYLFPEYSINLIAIILPYIELFAGLALVSGLYVRGAVLLINSMLTCFIIAITINLVRGHEFDCGCFSVGGKESSAVGLLVRDIIYYAVTVIIWLRFNKNDDPN